MEIASRTRQLIADLSGRLISAPFTPLTGSGELSPDDLERYVAALVPAVDGVCVWAHTGRGLHLPAAVRSRVLSAFRAATTGPVLAAVGPPVATVRHGATDRHAATGRPGAPGQQRAAGDFDEQLSASLRLAEQAAAGGADGLMAYPVPALSDPQTRVRRTLALHDSLAGATGLPVIGFLLYPGAGGVAYDPALLTELAARPHIAGVKLATLDDAAACRTAIDAVHAGGALAITGEDIMYGASLSWGADAALVGIAAAAARLSAIPLRAWFAGDTAAFGAASAVLDRFAATVFRPPVDGYVQRMLWVAEREGLIPGRAAHDPYGVPLHPDERAEVFAAYDAARARVQVGHPNAPLLS
ncbi:MAG: dihydrodipicolinate synthase family protein [Micromonosporaceae bacterium]|nr:dihydrodipicolinate synthase family protein [Micromonosporaceae bacterium]